MPTKLVLTIIADHDAENLMSALAKQRFGATRINSTGGIFGPGHSTILIGVEDHQVPNVQQMIQSYAAPRLGAIPYTHPPSLTIASFIEVEVGGYLSYVLDIEHFEQV